MDTDQEYIRNGLWDFMFSFWMLIGDTRYDSYIGQEDYLMLNKLL